MTTKSEITLMRQKDKIQKKNKLSYLNEVKEEFKSVTWTPRAGLITLTKVVLMTTLVVGLSIYFTDLSIRTFLGALERSIRLITG
jgi:preprotein translocase SecE subunit